MSSFPSTGTINMLSMIRPVLSWTDWNHYMRSLALGLAGFAILFKYFVRPESAICAEYEGPLADWERYVRR